MSRNFQEVPTMFGKGRINTKFTIKSSTIEIVFQKYKADVPEVLTSV